MYANVLLIHNWFAGSPCIMCIGAIVYAARPIRSDSADLPGKTWDVYLMLAVDLQMLTGLILYFGLSDFTKAAMENIRCGAWHDPSVRYWAILHAGAMFASLFTVRVARVLALNASDPASGPAAAARVVHHLHDRHSHCHPMAGARQRPPAVPLVADRH